MTLDNKLIIIHGGDNVEMPKPCDAAENYETEYLFEMTYAEIREKFRKTSYFLNST